MPIQIKSISYYKNAILNLVFPEWASDPMFYTNLVEGEVKEEEIFLTESQSVLIGSNNNNQQAMTRQWQHGATGLNLHVTTWDCLVTRRNYERID